jgi:hypothetical protein
LTINFYIYALERMAFCPMAPKEGRARNARKGGPELLYEVRRRDDRFRTDSIDAMGQQGSVQICIK